jgi:hypothetical protein
MVTTAFFVTGNILLMSKMKIWKIKKCSGFGGFQSR